VSSVTGIQNIGFAFSWPPRLPSATGVRIIRCAWLPVKTASAASVQIILCAAATSFAAYALIIRVVTTSRRARVEAQSAGRLLLR
jgi:hypothetical protein